MCFQYGFQFIGRPENRVKPLQDLGQTNYCHIRGGDKDLDSCLIHVRPSDAAKGNIRAEGFNGFHKV